MCLASIALVMYATEKDSATDLKEKLDYILFNDSERNRIIENAYQDVVNNHSYDKRIEKILTLLEFKTKVGIIK